MKFYLSFLLSTIILTSSCGKNSPPAYILPESTLVSFYVDRLILQEEAKLINIDSLTYKQQLDSLSRHYQIPNEELDRVIEDYKKDLNEWKRFYALVTKRLELLQMENTRTE
ncbi:MAG TPA: hypothetical protein VFF29_04785 [Bacteroidota bacterium]|nr:hypothetical protein [Bacteroidota bacterium]